MNKEKKAKQESSVEEIRKKIRLALNNRKFSMRSIEGIAKEVHVPEKKLKQIIAYDEELAKEIKYMPFRSKDGKVLLMSKERFIKEAPLKWKFIDFFASKRQGVKDA
ncbi:hypothetical protein BOO92_21580 [Vibrio navarrensis]|uniref:hypothetical protein n=1 Tax=Vibrio navarrensis TaxID=29495 RepID=UPI0018665035|nr:hypothetical protein [Vibrio navarrensis]MBE3659244.1 hypothetical protein [Vibrio navarrensis]